MDTLEVVTEKFLSEAEDVRVLGERGIGYENGRNRKSQKSVKTVMRLFVDAAPLKRQQRRRLCMVFVELDERRAKGDLNRFNEVQDVARLCDGDESIFTSVLSPTIVAQVQARTRDHQQYARARLA